MTQILDPTGVELPDDDMIVMANNRIGRKVPNLVIRGIDERELLAHAPSMICDRVHWDTVDDFDVCRLLPDLGMEAYSRRWSDGQHRIWVPVGRGYEARETVKQWSIDHEVEPINIRVEQKVPFRNLDLIPSPLLPELIATAVDWLYPRTFAIRRKIVADLDLIDDDDVRSMMYLFISDHADRYDADREGRNGTLNFMAFILGKMRTWPQDAARTAYGRTVVTDRLTLNRAADAIGAADHRLPTEAERADALRTSVTDLRRREQAISALSSVRHYQSLLVGSPDADILHPVQVAADADVESDATSYSRSAQMTSAIMAAVSDPTSTGRRAQDPLALAAVYLTFWEDLTRPEVARELEVLPKTANAAVARVLAHVEAAERS